MTKFIIQKRSNGEYQFHLRANNGQIILSSEGYSNVEACENGIQSVKINSQIDERFAERTARNNMVYFVLKAGNGQIIGTSEMYTTTQAMKNGIKSVKNGGIDAIIEKNY